MKLIVCGAGGMARETMLIAKKIYKSEDVILGYIDKDNDLKGTHLEDKPILGDLETFIKDYGETLQDVFAVVALGASKAREGIVADLLKSGISFTSLISPDVAVGASVTVLPGSIICAGTILTSNVKIGRHTIVNLSCTISHDVVIGDYCTIAPGVHLLGNTTVGNFTEIGAGSVIIPGVKIGRACTIGAGSVVTRDVESFATAYGVPAKPKGSNPKE